MKITLASFRASAVLVCAALAATANAQPAAANDVTATQPHKAEHANMRDPAKRQEHVTQRIAELKTTLKITPTQEPAWAAFTAAMQPAAHTKMPRPDHAEMEKLTPEKRHEKKQAMHKTRQEQMQAEKQKRQAATQTFYATLTPEQKKVFDGQPIGRRMHRESPTDAR